MTPVIVLKYLLKVTLKLISVLKNNIIKKIMQNKECSKIVDLINEKCVRRYNIGDLVLEQGKRPPCVIYIETGIAKVIHRNSKGKVFTFPDAQKGDYLGINSLLGNEKSFVSVIAAEPLTIYEITKHTLNNVWERKKEVSLELIKNLCLQLELIETKITEISSRNIKAQIASIFLANSMNEVIDGAGVDYSIAELANLVGASESYIYKVLAGMRKLQVISVKNKRVKIIDRHKLEKMVETYDEKYESG